MKQREVTASYHEVPLELKKLTRGKSVCDQMTIVQEVVGKKNIPYMVLDFGPVFDLNFRHLANHVVNDREPPNSMSIGPASVLKGDDKQDSYFSESFCL